jgi:hypothetical protein
MGGEVVEEAVEEGTGGAVHAWLLLGVVLSLVGGHVAEDAGLSLEFLLGGCLVCHEGVVVEAVAVDVVGIDLIDVLVVSITEVPAAGCFGIHGAAAPVVGDQIDVDEIVVDHELDAALFQLTILEGHDAVAYHDSLQVDPLP